MKTISIRKPNHDSLHPHPGYLPSRKVENRSVTPSHLIPPSPHPRPSKNKIQGLNNLCNQLHNPTSLLDLPLGLLAEVARAHDERHVGYAAFTEDFCVAEGQEVEDGGGVGLHGVGAEVLFAGFGGDEGPELCEGDWC